MTEYKVKLIMSEEYIINAETKEYAEKEARERFGCDYYIDSVEVTDNCEGSDCIINENTPKKEEKRKQYYASGMTLVEGKWQSCGWTIEADSFAEAAQIAESDVKFRIHSLSDNVMY